MLRRDLRLVSLSFTLFLLVCPASTRAGERATTSWDRAKAAQYLDKREQDWFNFDSANRGEGATKTTCVSCHSLLPYALARPALRRLSSDNQPTNLESRILVQVKNRVANWDRLDTPEFQLSYDFDEDKKKQSRGTEAILYALILAIDDRAQGRQEPSPNTSSALKHLWATQISDGKHKGSWDWLNFGLEPWESTSARYLGASLAAIAIGTSSTTKAEKPDKVEPPGPTLLRDYLKTNYSAQNLHNRLWLLWASTTMEGLLAPGDKSKLIEQVFAKQQQGGGWSLASLGDYKKKDVAPDIAQPDGYATGLVLHVLQLAGLSSGDPRVSSGLAWLRTNQDTAGAWRARSLNKLREPESTNPAKAHVGKFMWDAATAFSILALSH